MYTPIFFFNSYCRRVSYQLNCHPLFIKLTQMMTQPLLTVLIPGRVLLWYSRLLLTLFPCSFLRVIHRTRHKTGDLLIILTSMFYNTLHLKNEIIISVVHEHPLYHAIWIAPLCLSKGPQGRSYFCFNCGVPGRLSISFQHKIICQLMITTLLHKM